VRRRRQREAAEKLALGALAARGQPRIKIALEHRLRAGAIEYNQIIVLPFRFRGREVCSAGARQSPVNLVALGAPWSRLVRISTPGVSARDLLASSASVTSTIAALEIVARKLHVC
jgi:hypothetical protein